MQLGRGETIEDTARVLARMVDAVMIRAISHDDIAAACGLLARATNASRICVTMAEQGAALWEAGTLVTAPAPQVEVKDTVGAGDAFMAGLMMGLTFGVDPKTVLRNACRLGAVVASHNGATPLLPNELTQDFKNLDGNQAR